MKKMIAPVQGLVGRMRQRLGSETQKPKVERRSSQRAKLSIPIKVKVGELQAFESKLYDTSPTGLCFEASVKASAGDPVWIRFEGYSEVCGSFVLVARVVRASDGTPGRMAVKIDRQKSRPKALEEYRTLVLYFLRHRPLLEEKNKMFIEGRCESCGWVGRVGVRKPMCSRCGQPIKEIIS